MKRVLVCVTLLVLLFSLQVLANENYQKGIDAFNQKNYKSAIEFFKTAYQEMPEHHYLRYMMGLTFYRLSDYPNSILYFEEAKNLSPAHFNTLVNLSRACLNNRNWEKCLKTLELAKEVNEDDDLYNVWGLYYMNQGKYADSVEYFIKAVEINPKNYFALNNLGLAYLNQGKFIEASESLQKATELNPPYPYMYNNLGIAYENIGKLDKAIEAFNKALDINPNYSKAISNLERVLKKKYPDTDD